MTNENKERNVKQTGVVGETDYMSLLKKTFDEHEPIVITGEIGNGRDVLYGKHEKTNKDGQDKL